MEKKKSLPIFIEKSIPITLTFILLGISLLSGYKTNLIEVAILYGVVDLSFRK